jgi:uncharacterized protein with PIN domain
MIDAELKFIVDHNVGSIRPFTICLVCNRRLEGCTKETVKDLVPPYVFLTQDHFSECPACHRLYWKGTHWQLMSREMDAFWRFS